MSSEALATSRPEPAADEAGNRNLGEFAYEQLLGMMLNGALPAGAAVQERALAKSLAISRTPVREALAKLEAEGFLTRHAQRFLTVRAVPVQELMHILDVRAVLEIEAVGLAVGRVPPPLLAELRALHEEEIAGAAPTHPWSLDDRLHGTIADASGNPVLADMIRDLRRRTRMFNFEHVPQRFVQSCEEHLAVIAGLERQDARVARQALTTHLDKTRDSILHKLDNRDRRQARLF